MNTPNQNGSMSVIQTGIAVACAVIVALGFLFFGTQFFNKISTNSVAATATTTTTTNNMDDSSTTPNTSAGTADATAAGTVDTAAVAGIPANVTQLMTKDIAVGTGAEAKAGDTVTVQYVGLLTNGTIFDASANHGTTGFTFNLGAGQVIKGWDEGVVGMKVGGKRELVIPASLGYGAQAVGSIPANSTLVFEVELLNVQPGTSAAQ